MPPPQINLTPGSKVGRWTLLHEVEPKVYDYPRGPKKSQKERRWFCRCDCGTEKVLHYSGLRDRKSGSCGCLKKELQRARVRERSFGWKGGRITNSSGYVMVLDRDNPSSNANGYVLEHRSVMEEHLGRQLLPTETVHHKNGVKDDNRLENLELWSSNHSDGQRVTDKVKWAKEILRLYEPEALNDAGS